MALRLWASCSGLRTDPTPSPLAVVDDTTTQPPGHRCKRAQVHEVAHLHARAHLPLSTRAPSTHAPALQALASLSRPPPSVHQFSLAQSIARLVRASHTLVQRSASAVSPNCLTFFLLCSFTHAPDGLHHTSPLGKTRHTQTQTHTDTHTHTPPTTFFPASRSGAGLSAAL